MHLRHGGAGRLPTVRTNLSGLEYVPDNRRLRGGLALALTLLRSDSLLSGVERRSPEIPRRIFGRPSRRQNRADDVSPQELSAFRHGKRRDDYCIQIAPTGRLRGREGALAAERSGRCGEFGGYGRRSRCQSTLSTLQLLLRIFECCSEKVLSLLLLDLPAHYQW